MEEWETLFYQISLIIANQYINSIGTRLNCEILTTEIISSLFIVLNFSSNGAHKVCVKLNVFKPTLQLKNFHTVFSMKVIMNVFTED